MTTVSEMTKNDLIAVLKRLTGGPIGDYDRQSKQVILSRVLDFPVDAITSAITEIVAPLVAMPVPSAIPAPSAMPAPEGTATALADAIRAVVQSAGVDT